MAAIGYIADIEGCCRMSAFGGTALQRVAESHLLLILQLIIKTVLPQETAAEAPGTHRASTASSVCGCATYAFAATACTAVSRRGGVGLGLSERLVPMHLSTMGPRSAIHEDHFAIRSPSPLIPPVRAAAGSFPRASRTLFLSRTVRPLPTKPSDAL